MGGRSPLSGVSARQGRYVIKHVLKHAAETKVMTAIAIDTKVNEQRVILKRWECTDFPVARRAKELVYYEQSTERFAHLRHPLIPRVLDRFAEGKHYYAVLEYINGDNLEDRSLKLLHPLPQPDIFAYIIPL